MAATSARRSAAVRATWLSTRPAARTTNRTCSLHQYAAPDDEAPSVAQLLAALADGGYPRLVEVSHGCPACKLAALRQSFVAPGAGEPWLQEPNDGRDQFDFKKEVKAMWDNHNEDHRDYY